MVNLFLSHDDIEYSLILFNFFLLFSDTIQQLLLFVLVLVLNVF